MSVPTICGYFMRGSCRFGDRCWNSHDLGSARSDSPYRHSETTDDEESFGGLHSPTQYASPPATSAPASRAKPKNQTSTNVSKKSQKNTNQSMWILTNNISGEEREGTPDSTLVEVVKKLNDAENQVVTLTQQLRSKNEGDNFSWIEHQIEQCIDNDLQCNICYEMFIKPTVLNCSHTFCHECIESWTRRVNHCPTCRVYVKNKSYCLTLDTFLDKIADCLPEEVKIRRESLKIERNNNRVEPSRNRRNNIRRRNNRQSMRQRLGVLWGERDRDGAEWNIALEEALFDPIRLGDVLGRNRNDNRELWEDELSDSSLDSNYEYGYICSYCDDIGHSSSDCPISIMEETTADWLN